MKHDVRSCGCDFTKYLFQKRRENNSLSFILKADNCKLQVLSSRSVLNCGHFLPFARTISSTLGSSQYT